MLKPLLMTLMLAGPAVAQPGITLVSPDAWNWETTPEGVGFAALDGDRFAEPYSAMVRLPAGTVSPLHVKSADMIGVMIEGTMTHTLANQPAEPIGPGAFYRIPAGLAHISSCVSDVPCITFLYQDGAFDFVPVTQ